MDQLRKSFQASSRMATIAGALVALSTLFGIGAEIAGLMAGSRAIRDLPPMYFDVFAVTLVVFALAVAAFIAWTALSYRNLRALGVSNLQYSFAWAIGGWFVPVLNLLRPYQVVREIWEQTETYCRQAEDRISDLPRSASLVLTWWLLFIARGLVSGLGGPVMVREVHLSLEAILIAASGIAACLVIWKIHGMQQRAVELALRSE